MIKDTEKIDTQRAKWRIFKNVTVIGVAFMVEFTAYHGTSNLQSSINSEAGLGTAALSAVYAGMIISSIFLPAAIIKFIGTKWTICVSLLFYMPYIAVQLYPRFYTMVPAAFILGLGAGPLWCAKCIYLSVVSDVLSKTMNIPSSVLMARFLGLFYFLFHLNEIWGNLLSSLVISSGNNEAAVTSVNASLIPELCGANFLAKSDAKKALRPQPPEKIQMLTGIFLACMAGAALIVAVGVDSIKRYKTSQDSSSQLSGVALLTVTMKLLLEPKQLLIILITVFIGLQHTFFTADFTAAFVSCAVGTGSVGLIMLTHGIADAVSCGVTGYLVKITGRVPLLTLAFVIQSALFITVLLWRPQSHLYYVLYIIAVFWGICNSLWLVQLNGLCGDLFPGREAAAYSNFRVWDAIGYIIAYLWSPYLRTSVKIYTLFAVMIVGIMFYYYVEFKESRHKAIKKSNEKGHDNTAFTEF